MRASLRTAFLLVALVAVLGACSAEEQARELPPISAAASTCLLLEELAAVHAREGGARFRVDAAASSTLARQIERGKPFSLFVSAHEMWTQHLVVRGVGDASSRFDWLGNSLVWVRNRNSSFALAPGPSLPAAWKGRLVVGDPDHVPCGIYAKQALQHHGLWSRFHAGRGAVTGPSLLPAASAAAALRTVAEGHCETGILYASDAASCPDLVVLHEFAAQSHEPIRYPVLLPRDPAPAVRSFVRWLQGAQAREVVLRHGFRVISP